MIPPVFSSFYNNPCLKDVQACYAKESPISLPDPIASPAILTHLQCMRARSSFEYTIPRRRNRRRSRQQQEAIPIVDKYPIQMADDRPMAEQLQAPTGGFANQPNETNMNNLESDDEAVDTPIVYLFPPSDNDLDGEEFTKTLQSILTTRKLSKRESPREIIDLDHFYDT
ncbi:hypothetical protein Tco_0868780, partial [Tanacetum coccineum]